jgi:hypothetical protein
VTDDGAVNATLTTNDKCSLHIIFFSSGNLFCVLSSENLFTYEPCFSHIFAFVMY